MCSQRLHLSPNRQRPLGPFRWRPLEVKGNPGLAGGKGSIELENQDAKVQAQERDFRCGCAKQCLGGGVHLPASFPLLTLLRPGTAVDPGDGAETAARQTIKHDISGRDHRWSKAGGMER